MNNDKKQEALFEKWMNGRKEVTVPDDFSSKLMARIESYETNRGKSNSGEEGMANWWNFLMSSWSTASAVMVCSLFLGFLRAFSALLFILMTNGEGY